MDESMETDEALTFFDSFLCQEKKGLGTGAKPRILK